MEKTLLGHLQDCLAEASFVTFSLSVVSILFGDILELENTSNHDK